MWPVRTCATSSGEYNLPVIKRLFRKGEVQVVTFALWEQGLVLVAGNPKNIRGVEDLARKNVRIVNREPGAGSRELLDEKLRQAGVSASAVHGYTEVAPGHLPLVHAVRDVLNRPHPAKAGSPGRL